MAQNMYNIGSNPTGRKSKEYVVVNKKSKWLDELKESFLEVTHEMWPELSKGTHIRYVVKNKPGETLPIDERIKMGGFIKSNGVFNNVPTFWLESHPGGNKSISGYINYPVVYSGVERLWKKHHPDIQIEIKLMKNSLLEIRKEMAELKSRLDVLEKK